MQASFQLRSSTSFNSYVEEHYILAYDAIALKYCCQAIDVRPLHNARQIASELESCYLSDDGKRFAPPDRNPYDECFEKAKRIWAGARQLTPDLPQHGEDRGGQSVFILKPVFDSVFSSPLIPNSPLLNYVRSHFDRDNAGILDRLAGVALLIEGIVRPFICLCGSLILNLYALKNRDLAEYYRFRLLFNRTDPLVMATKSLGIVP